ncbi:MAG: single-stranded DNA-binding protein [Bacteroidetes bacterium]|nr:single-stranded DNA-binding protein [Bacteroidota bacterium]
MAKGTLNKVILIGRLGADPELRFTPNGAAVASFNMATNESYKDKEGKPVDQTDWHRIVAWRKLAEICGQYLKKGSLVYIEGKLKTRSYDDKEGVKRYVTEIVADNMQMLDSRKDSSGGGSMPAMSSQGGSSEPVGSGGADDDLPF